MSGISRKDVRFNQLRFLIDAVQSLSMPYEEQLQREPSFVNICDEFEQALSDPMYVLKESGNMDVLSPEQTNDVDQLLGMLQAMRERGEAWLWSRDGLRTAPEWERVRTHAKNMIAKHGWTQLPERE